MYATLYARALNGKIKVGKIDYMYGKIMTQAGYLGGNLAIHTSVPKMASVDSELLSKVKAKKKEGYKDSNDIFAITNEVAPNDYITKEWLERVLPDSNLDANYNLKPMKCQKFRVGKMQYPALAQPKINGVRGVLRWESELVGEGIFAELKHRAVIRSKSGLEYHLPHITNGLNKEFFIDEETGLELAYDGELYLHGQPLNIINSACPLISDKGVIAKTSNPSISKQLQFVIFDLAVEDLAQIKRTKILENTMLTEYDSFFLPILGSKFVYSDDEVIEYTLECINKGYEGVVVRNLDAEYSFGGRPMTIMKSKQFQDAEFEIIDIISKHELEHSDGSDIKFILKNDINDYPFDCTPMYSHVERLRMAENKQDYIGKFATVKFYERSGVKKVPFHANVVTIRDYE